MTEQHTTEETRRIIREAVCRHLNALPRPTLDLIVDVAIGAVPVSPVRREAAQILLALALGVHRGAD